MFESVPDYRNIVSLKFSVENNLDNFQECGILKNDNNCLYSELKENLILQQIEDHLDDTQNQREAIIESFLIK